MHLIRRGRGLRAAVESGPPSHPPHAPPAEMMDPGYWPRSIGLRVIIAASYFLLIPAGLLPMSSVWWMVSGGGLLVYSVVMFGCYLRWPAQLWLHKNAGAYVDVLTVTLAIVAVARPGYPIWVGYFLIISSASIFWSSRAVLAFSAWTIVLFLASVAILDASGRAAVSWQLTAVVSIMAVFTALNADLISKGSRNLREMVLQASLTDPLTGLANRRRFRDILDAHGLPDTRPLAVVMYDVDNFKALNEEFGHLHADGVLVHICAELRATFRDADVVARYGGDELVVLAHVESCADAMHMAERSLACIIDMVGVTVSAGVAVYPLTSDTLEGAVRAADQALGAAKHGGKARVAAAPALTAA